MTQGTFLPKSALAIAHSRFSDLRALGSSWRAENIAFVVMTIDRTPCYLSETLASMFKADPSINEFEEILLMHGSPTTQTTPVVLSGRVPLKMRTMCQREWNEVAEYSVHRRFCANYARCLATISNRRGIVVCEDDIVFAPNFLKNVLRTLNEIFATGVEDFALSAYFGTTRTSDFGCPAGEHFSRYPPHRFFGTQFMFYTRGVATVLQARMLEDGVHRARMPGDLLIAEYFRQHDALFITARSLVQHIGVASTGLGQFHRAPDFAAQ
jgi:hypothetical protein